AAAVAPPAPTEASADAGPGKTAETGDVAPSSQEAARRWRALAGVASVLAVALGALIAIQLLRPDWLPEGLRPKPRVRIVEVQAPAAPVHAQYVAVLQKDGGAPAFIL